MSQSESFISNFLKLMVKTKSGCDTIAFLCLQKDQLLFYYFSVHSVFHPKMEQLFRKVTFY